MTSMHSVIPEEKLTEAYRLLLEMRDNCVKHADDKYDDPKRKAKYEALNIAMAAMGRSIPPHWISVEDEQKPMHGHSYLCVCTLPNDPEHKFDFISVRWWNAATGNGYVDRPHFSDEGFEGMTVTHWMPLPQPPKEE